MLLGLKMGVKAVQHFSERHQMSKRDEEIDKERERERSSSENTSRFSDGEHDISINHFSHQHPLHKSNLHVPFKCNSCEVSSAHGWAYTCKAVDCTYILHDVCARPPMSTLRPSMDPSTRCSASDGSSRQNIRTFAHLSDHPMKDVYSNLEFQCEHCFTTGKGRRYKCDECDVCLHPVCAKNPTRLSTFMHPQHELELRTKKRFKCCNICGDSLKAGQKELNLRVYGCKECKFLVHPVCSQLPQYLVHGLHVMPDSLHPLQLKNTTSTTKCEADCGSYCTPGWQYVCSICSVSFHICCILADNNSSSSEDQLANMIRLALGLADASGFGLLDVATFMF